MSEPSGARRVRFGVFDLDVRTGELRKSGVRLKLQDQPFQILRELVLEPGELVTRERLQEKLWPEETFVDFDHSLNAAVKKLRDILGDDARGPRFIETLPKKGYRFIAPVEAITEKEAIPQEEKSSPSRWRLVLGALAAALVAAAHLAWLAPNPSRTRFREIPLTSYPGSEVEPSLSPDGTRVAFSWDGGDGGNQDIYVQLIGADESAPLRLTTDPAPDVGPKWSRDGSKIAFARVLEPGRAPAGGLYAVMQVGALGGSEQKLFEAYSRTEHYVHPEWSPDGRHIVYSGRLERDGITLSILARSLESGEAWELASAGTGMGAMAPVIAPDGLSVAFIRRTLEGDGFQLLLQPLSRDLRPVGEPRRLDVGLEPVAPAWSPDSAHLYVFAGDQARGRGLWSVDPSGATEPRFLMAVDSPYLDASRATNGGIRLVYAADVEDGDVVEVDLSDPAREPATVVQSTKHDFYGQYSPDGERIAFVSNRSGSPAVWVCDRDGRNARLLAESGITTFFNPHPAWSPDGRWVAFHGQIEERRNSVYVVGLDGSRPRRVTELAARWAAWSRDGRFIYFLSDSAGQVAIWKVSWPPSGDPRKVLDVTQFVEVRESWNGRKLYYLRGETLFAIPLEEPHGDPEVLIEGASLSFDVTEEGVYFVEAGTGIVKLFDPRIRKTREVARLAPRPSHPRSGLSVSEGRWLLYTRQVRAGHDLVLLEAIE